jgi:hypothetical protein
LSGISSEVLVKLCERYLNDRSFALAESGSHRADASLQLRLSPRDVRERLQAFPGGIDVW